MKIKLLIILMILVLSGCANQPQGFQGRKGQVGVAVGSGVGALIGQAIGNNTESTLIGAGFGALFGYIIGNEIDKYDTQIMGSVFENGRSGQSVVWQNPDTRNTYSMTPQPAYKSEGGKYCRVAEINALINGKPETIETLACRDEYGKWELKK